MRKLIISILILNCICITSVFAKLLPIYLYTDGKLSEYPVVIHYNICPMDPPDTCKYMQEFTIPSKPGNYATVVAPTGNNKRFELFISSAHSHKLGVATGYNLKCGISFSTHGNQEISFELVNIEGKLSIRCDLI